MWGIYRIPTPEEREVAQEQIDAVFTILEDWFQAIESGTTEHRLVDPTFVPPLGRPAITEELIKEFIGELDREIDTDAFSVQGKSTVPMPAVSFIAWPIPSASR